MNEIKSKRIAIVEDDEPILDAVSMVLESYGWEVDMFKTGEDFLLYAESNTPDVLLLDPHLPGINGSDVVRLLPTTLTAHSMRIIVFTAHPNSRELAKLRQQKIEDVLLKPVTEETLVASLVAH